MASGAGFPHRLDDDVSGWHPFALVALIGLVGHHALGEHALEGLAQAHMAGHLHRSGEEARIEQMQNRVLDAANILVHRQPAIGHSRNGGRVGVGGSETRKIPGTVDKCVHGVGFAPRGTATLRAIYVLPGGVMVERIARLVEGHVLGQHHRQVLLRHGKRAADLTVDHRNGAAPIALARNAPVTQAVIDLNLTLRLAVDRAGTEMLGDPGLGFIDREAIKEIGIEDVTGVYIGFAANGKAVGIGIRRQHHRRDRQIIFARKVEIALVMRRAAEHRAGAVIHQHEIGDIDGQRLPFDYRMLDAQASEDAFFLCLFKRFGRGALAMEFGNELGQGRVIGRHLGAQRMVGR